MSSMILGASPATFFSFKVTHPGRLGVPWLSSLVHSVQGHALVLPRIHSFRFWPHYSKTPYKGTSPNRGVPPQHELT